MHEAIKSKPKVVDKRKPITNAAFEGLIHEVYDIMLDYTRISGKMITKNHPILVGNVTFWFNTDDDTGESFLKFEPSVPVWQEKLMRDDLNRHVHDLYYNEIKR